MISLRSRILVISISFLALTNFVACTNGKSLTSTDSPTADIFSNRQIGAVDDLYLVTLTSPPILAVSTKTKSGWKVPATAKARLLNEQAKFEEKLKAIAPDAKIIYRYHMTLNALAIYSSTDVESIMVNLPGVKSVTPALEMARPLALNIGQNTNAASAVNSVNFIGADEAHKLGFTGKGMRIGILDTGIDYTHSMLGGSGKKGDYAAIDPAKPSTAFPNEKVVGGIDLVGSDFNAASPLAADHLPQPDANPLDEAGHGSHVAGTIAGRGDGVKTYDGVAPDAKLYAIKVFGKEGSTADAVVIAGFEFAADPNGDLNPDDQLDVINMSLGGGFGQPRVLYNEAVKNLSRAGTVVVASAGNSGSVDYIVGAPSTSDEAISVAASIDGSPINWQYAAVSFTSPGFQPLNVKAVEGPLSKPVTQAGGVGGELVDIGDASTDLPDPLKAQLNGKVAMIQRGKATFAVKLQRAVAAGAIGAVVYTNDDKAPIPMGGEGSVGIPAIMVSQAVGLQLLTQMKTKPVTVQFKTDKTIEEPGNIDTITDFSSKGPRSEDSLLKPEIAAPGQNITSAGMGTGSEGVKMDGTSMAAPHMTGAIALIKQAHPELSSNELKSLAMGTSKVLSKNGEIPITLQGAGRIQIDQAITAPVMSETASISLGRVQLQQQMSLNRSIVLRNLTNADLTLTITSRAAPGLTITVPQQVSIPALGRVAIMAKFDFTMQNPQAQVFELDGRILFNQNQKTVLQIPAMAIRTQASLITAAQADSSSVKLSNSSPNMGLALAFNLLGQDPRKPKPGTAEAWKSRACDLQSAGYRILRKDSPTGSNDVIQFAFKVYDPVTTWVQCSVSVLVDSDGDGIADQEIAGVSGSGLEGVDKVVFTTVVLDAAKARGIRLAYETDLSSGKNSKIDYTPAVLARGSMAPFSQSTLVVIEAPLDTLARGADGKLHLKLASQADGGETFQADKYLGGPLGTWLDLSPKLEDQGHYGMEEVTTVPAAGASMNLSKGSGTQDLVVYYPLNEFVSNGRDAQQQILGK